MSDSEHNWKELPSRELAQELLNPGTGRPRVFSSEVDTGSRQENASNQESRA
jgi:hypothetical protein